MTPDSRPRRDEGRTHVATLLSVNVGLPRDIVWRGRTVYTGIWKYPVQGRCSVARLHLHGDGQGDLAGHGGEQRAVFVYQMDSYHYWQSQLNRSEFTPGQFGENFTIDGLPDDAVCIGDRYQIGSAVFEVTQPRVTCYRVGIRMDEPRMPALLTSSGRPGFYFRVLQEGDVGAGDEIVKVGEADVLMTIAEVNALLYSPNHSRDRLARALQIPALSPGWRLSFAALLASHGSGNAGLLPEEAAHPTAPGFSPLTVSSVVQESADVQSILLDRADREPLAEPMPGQYVVLRLPGIAGGRTLFRSYSLSGLPSATRYRISVKVEPHGAGGSYVRDHVRQGGTVEVSAPRGSFILQPGKQPVVLLSAGIGLTPVLAMLNALAAARSSRRVYWLHTARDGEHHPFADEVRTLMESLPNGSSYVCYSNPLPRDKLGVDFDAKGYFSPSIFNTLGIPQDSNVYLCGPPRFMTDMRSILAPACVEPGRIQVELFNGGVSVNPGVVGAPLPPPHLPAGEPGTGPLLSFARSGIAVPWKESAYQNILELAEACDIPVRWSCRSGVCHTCESGLVSGRVAYTPAPLDLPADGNVLVCCAQPDTDLVIDL